MKVSELKKIYPQANESNYQLDDKNKYQYFDGLTYLIIERADLSPEEILLLDSMSKKSKEKSLWYQYLIDKKEVKVDDIDSLQCLYFFSQNLSDNKMQWLESFKSFFKNVYDGFYINEAAGVIIVDQYNEGLEELEGYVHMLDDDFSTSTSLFIGMNTNSNNIKNIFDEEFQLFLNNKKSGRVLNFTDVYIFEYIAPGLKSSFISQHIKSLIKNDDDLVNLIKSLWKHQGNQSASADDLFIHRNTLNYRIDKLYSEHKLNLRNTQELLLCYLLVI